MRDRYGERPVGGISQLLPPKPKLPRCGSEDPAHRVQQCRPCRNQRQKEWRHRKGLNPDRPSCVMCGIARGNSQSIPVTRYPLIRYVKAIDSNRCIGSLPLCDVCVADNAKPSRSYVRANGSGFRGAAA